MHSEKLRRIVLAATILLTLAVPAVGSFAGPQDEIDENSQELDELGDRIDRNASEKHSLEGEIDELNRDITELQLAINGLDAQIAEVKAEIRTVEAQIDATQQEIAEVEDQATEQAVELYKSGGGTNTLQALLDAATIAELNDRLEMMDVVAQNNTDALIVYTRLKFEIETANRELFIKKDNLEAKFSDQTRIEDELASKKKILDKRLAQVTDKLVQDRSHEAGLLAQNRELRQEILQNQAPPGVDIGPPSASGFIWPLNNAVTSSYGPRWGRMHTGLDIDGYTGEPIVASNSGTVISAGSMGGYGNAVVIDHGNGISTLYAHMSQLGTSSGASLRAGQLVGYVGATGNVTGDHLHFEVRVNGSPTDPMQYLP